jgi:phosphoglycerol transferase
LVGSVGFVFLLGRLFYRRRSREPATLDGLALLNLAALVLGTCGGLGALFNFMATPMIRAYNRISVFVAFFCLAAVALLLDKLLCRLPAGRARWAFHAMPALVLVGGVLDQTAPSMVPYYSHLKKMYDAQAEFVGRIEATLPPGAMVWQMPSIGFPETPPIATMGCYDHLRGYLHSRQLRWSHGSMHGRPEDRWRVWLAEQSLEDMVQDLVWAGFRGIYLDRQGYADLGAKVEPELSRLLGVSPMVSTHQRLSFFDLTRYAAGLRQHYSDEEWAARQEETLHPLFVSWAGGFYPQEGHGPDAHHWCGAEGELVLTNPLPRPRRVRLSLSCTTVLPGPARLHVHSSMWKMNEPLDSDGQTLCESLLVPPGEHRIRFRCDARPLLAPPDPRILTWGVTHFLLREDPE